MLLKKENPKSNVEKTVEEKLKEIIAERKREKLLSAKISHEEMYERMVEEAVLVITKSWEDDATYYDPWYDLGQENVKLKARDAFFITEKEYRLYSSNHSFARNPNTRRNCFFDSFVFSSKEEVDKYLEDVMARLPANTKVSSEEKTGILYQCFGPSTSYSFELDVEL